MAQNQSPTFFMVALLLLLAAAAPPALAQGPPPGLQILGQLPLGPQLSGITVNGTVCCTPTGSCPGGPPLAGVPVTLTCRVLGVNITVGQGITGVDGAFKITVGNLLYTLLGPIGIIDRQLPCTVPIKLPLSQVLCPVLNLTNSVMSGVPVIVSTVVSQATGLVTVNATVLSFGISVSA